MRVLQRRREEGQVMLLALGYTVMAILLVVGTVALTTVQIARVRLYAISDAAALDASDTIDLRAYEAGVPDAVPVADRGVVDAAGSYLRNAERPPGVTSWRLAPGTGSPDGRSAVVRLRASIRLPFLGGVLDAVGGSVAVTVESRASAELGS
jgi:hypothetical protein